MIQYESKMRDQYILQHSDEMYDDYDEEELMHYGVKGMRWGHRKSSYAPDGDYRARRRRRVIAGVAGAAAAIGAGALLARTGRGKLVRSAIAGHARSAKRVFGPSISGSARNTARRVGNSTPVVGAYYHGSRAASFFKRHGATTLSSIRSGASRAGSTVSGHARSANRVFGVTTAAKNAGTRAKKAAFNASLYPRYAGVVAKSYASKGASAASGVAKRASSTARRAGATVSGHARSAARVYGPSVKNRAIRTAAYPVGAASAAGSAVKRGASTVTGAARRTGTKAAGAIKRKKRLR